MAGENVGTIYFTVEAETSKLINGTQAADSSLDRLERQFGKTDKAAGEANFTMTKTAAAVRGLGRDADGASSSLGGLGKVLGGLLTLQGVNNLIQMAEGYNEMAERVRMASASVAEYEMVQRRLLATANGTYRSLAEAQEIYIRTADSLRTMGYSASESLDITDSLSYAFVRSATSADRAQIAMGAFSRSLSKGRVDSDAWEMLLISIPSLAQDMATALGKTSEEIRKMGAEGKLTTDQLAEGFRKALSVNKAAADGMAVTVRDAFTSMRNNLTAYVGEANQASGATSVMSAAIVGLGENIDVIVKSLMTAGAGALALYIARTGAAALSSAQAMLAARAEAAENLRLAQARTVATQAALAHAQANAGLTGTFAALTSAENANRAATTALVAAQRAAASTGATLLGILGGPVGIIGLVASAAAGMYLFSDSANTAKIDLAGMGDTLEDVKKKISELSESQRKLAEQSAQLDLDAAVRKLGEAFDSLARGSLADGTRAVAKWRAENTDGIAEVIESAKRGEISYQELDSALLEMVESYAQVNGRSREWVSQMTEQIATTAKTALEAENARQKLDLVAEANRQVAAAARDAAAGTRELSSAMNDAQTDDYLKRLQERRQAIEDDGSATKAAERYISSLKDVSEERIQQIRQEATEIDRLNAAKRAKTAATKAESEGERKAKQAAEERRRADEANIETLDRLGQALYFAGLQGEALAVAQARASLNQFATPEQVEQGEAMARALFNIQQIEQQRQKFGSGQQADQYIMGNVQPLSGGAFDDQYARYEAEAEAEQKRYDDQLERLRQARELQIETKRSYDELEQEAAKQHADRMAQIEQAKNHVMLASASDAFGALAGVMKQSQGEQSGIYKAMFAASKAFAIADATVNAYSAISKAWNSAPFPANLGAVAATTPQVMSVVSAISGASYSGRQYGGPTQPGKMYRINENGAPEVFNAANGQQFMLPNTRGHVVSNKDATTNESNGVSVVVNVHNAPPGTQVEQQRSDKELIIDVMIEDVATGGRFTEAGSSMLGWRRQGR
ncbi:tape measure protein [Alcaligenes sp. Lyrl_28]|uniref:tape measure protein n=1 Tax=Alcaligenes sp. Lyrl_28 TaxID=3110924 RepID=UPI003F7C1044